MLVTQKKMEWLSDYFILFNGTESVSMTNIIFQLKRSILRTYLYPKSVLTWHAACCRSWRCFWSPYPLRTPPRRCCRRWTSHTCQSHLSRPLLFSPVPPLWSRNARAGTRPSRNPSRCRRCPRRPCRAMLPSWVWSVWWAKRSRRAFWGRILARSKIGLRVGRKNRLRSSGCSSSQRICWSRSRLKNWKRVKGIKKIITKNNNPFHLKFLYIVYPTQYDYSELQTAVGVTLQKPQRKSRETWRHLKKLKPLKLKDEIYFTLYPSLTSVDVKIIVWKTKCV